LAAPCRRYPRASIGARRADLTSRWFCGMQVIFKPHRLATRLFLAVWLLRSPSRRRPWLTAARSRTNGADGPRSRKSRYWFKYANCDPVISWHTTLPKVEKGFIADRERRRAAPASGGRNTRYARRVSLSIDQQRATTADRVRSRSRIGSIPRVQPSSTTSKSPGRDGLSGRAP